MPKAPHTKTILITVIVAIALILIGTGAYLFLRGHRSDPIADRGKEQTMSTHVRPGASTLILYFSLNGTTEDAAQRIHRLLPGSRVERLQAKVPYKGYDDASSRGMREWRQNIHPALAAVPDISHYDTIVLGFPVWFEIPPKLINTLFDEEDFAGKTIVPFCTSSSTPMSSPMKVLRRLAAADHARIVDGLRFDGDETALAAWLKRVGLPAA